MGREAGCLSAQVVRSFPGYFIRRHTTVIHRAQPSASALSARWHYPRVAADTSAALRETMSIRPNTILGLTTRRSLPPLQKEEA